MGNDAGDTLYVFDNLLSLLVGKVGQALVAYNRAVGQKAYRKFAQLGSFIYDVDDSRVNYVARDSKVNCLSHYAVSLTEFIM